MRRSTFTTLALCLTLAGCGGGDGEKAAATDALVADASALADGAGSDVRAADRGPPDARAEADAPAEANASAGLDAVADGPADLARESEPVTEDARGAPMRDLADDLPASDGPLGDGGRADTGGETGAAGPDAPSTFCPGCSLVTLPIPGEHLAYDAGRKRLYVTVSGSFVGGKLSGYADSLVIVDAATATVTGTLPLGKSPGPLGLSDDGSTLWVGIAGQNAVRKVSLTDPPVTGPLITLPPGSVPDAPSEARSIVVLPGSQTSIAVAAYDAYGQTAFILDDGVPRTARLTEAPGFLINGPSGHLFGVNRFGELAVVRVANDGLTQTTFRGLLGRYENHLVYTGSQLFATQGEVIDIGNLEQPIRAGVFAQWGSIGTVAPTRWLMVWADSLSSGVALDALDPRTFTAIASVPLPPEINQSRTYPGDLVYLGGDGVAFLAEKFDNDEYLFVVHAPPVAP
jgi:hypothetical protein